jgi:hypothetical protein
MKKQKWERPNLVEQIIYYGQKNRTINYEVEELVEGGYEFNSIALPPAVWDYGIIVDRLIKEHYPNGQMEAILNNYLFDPTDSEFKAKFDKMQEFRNYAKEIAKQAMQYVVDNNL